MASLQNMEWCGAKWVTEYNCDTKILTVWHEGKHNWVLKCQSISKEEKEAKKDLLKTVLGRFPILQKTKLIDVGGLLLLLLLFLPFLWRLRLVWASSIIM